MEPRDDVFIVGACRTPIGKFLGAFKDVSAVDLGAIAIAEALKRAGIPMDSVQEVSMGLARQAGNGPNPARQMALKAAVPKAVPAYTVNMACGSGMKAVALAAQAIRMGEADVMVAGGAENMTRVPFFLEHERLGYRVGHSVAVDGMYQDGFMDPIAGLVMGETAEVLVEKYNISREEQDRFALSSQQKAEIAMKNGKFADEIVSVATPAGVIVADEHPRSGSTLEKLAALPPVFKKNGSVTAGNSSGITDGAAALVLCSAEALKRHGLKPLAAIGDCVSVGVEPREMGMGPYPALLKLFKRTGAKLDDYDLIELNEAFAAQVLAVHREMPLPMERLNVNGGAIALGHPIGCTGARIIVTLLYEMMKRGAKQGLATLCISGGQGMAMEVLR
ncbi:MAG: thiolase family protein [bacterium]